MRDSILQMPKVLSDRLAQARRIQITAARPDEPPLPLEICYDGDAPARDAAMCPQWREALASGDCQATCPLDRSTVVCPVAFWGLSRIIERHAYDKADAAKLPDTGYALQTEPTGSRRRLALTNGSICAAAADARKVDAVSIDLAFEAAGRISLPTIEVKDWKSWRAEVAKNPSLLILLAHTDQEGRTRTLVIGEGPKGEFLSSITPSYVGTGAGQGPIALLLGCSTGVSDLAFQSIVARFRFAGAAIVIGTLCEILGRHAGPIANRILHELKRATSTPDGVPLGDLMTGIRRKLLAEGYPIVLAVTSFGDADWLI